MLALGQEEYDDDDDEEDEDEDQIDRNASTARML